MPQETYVYSDFVFIEIVVKLKIIDRKRVLAAIIAFWVRWQMRIASSIDLVDICQRPDSRDSRELALPSDTNAIATGSQRHSQRKFTFSMSRLPSNNKVARPKTNNGKAWYSVSACFNCNHKMRAKNISSKVSESIPP